MENPKDVQHFLQNHHGAVVSTVNFSGKPEAAFIYYTLDEESNFYFITKNQTRKAKNLEINKSVAIVISDEELMQTLQMEGTASLVEDSKLTIHIMNTWLERNITNKENWPPPLFKLNKGSLLIFKVKIDWTHLSDFRWAH